MLNRSRFVKRNLLVFSLTLLVLLYAGFAQTSAPKQLTIEQIFREGGITGRAPETIKWSPDGTKVSFVQRDDSGDEPVKLVFGIHRASPMTALRARSRKAGLSS